MGWTNIAIDILLFCFVVTSVLMCLVVLMQKGKQDGLGATFGGGIMQDFMGSGTSVFLVKTTCVLAALFFILSISLARLYSHRASLMEKGSPLQQELMKPVAPATPTTPAPAPAPAATPMTATPAAAPAPAASTPAPVAPTKPAAK